jgi:hypothetical protein
VCTVSDAARKKYHKPARILAFALVWGGLAVWLYHFHVYYKYDETQPLVEDFASGRIYPQNNHGHVVYLTKEEGNRLTKLTAVAFSLIISGFLVGRYFVGKDEFGLRRTPKPWEIKRF